MTQPPSSSVAARPDVDTLVATHLPLARYAVNTVAARLQLPAHVRREDLLSSAQMALLEAARRYDPTLGASFATYARPRLQGAVLDELRANDWASRTVRAEARRLEAATEALTAELGRAPSREQVAARLGISPGEVDALHGDIHRAVLVSIDEGVNPAARLAEAETPERALLGRERVGYLLAAIDALPDRLGEVVERNFFDEEALTDIAADLGLTLSRVSQMRAQGLRLLHAALSEIVDGQPVPETGGSRARAQQRRYIAQVVTSTGDPRTRLSAPSRLVSEPDQKKMHLRLKVS